MKEMKIHFILALLILAVNLINFASSMTIDSVNAGELYPGEEANIKIEIKNTLNEDVEDVSFILGFSDPVTQKALPLNSVGSSEDSADEITEDDDETFEFKIRASSNADTGDYSMPYLLTYTLIDSNEKITKTGTIGITIKGDVKLDYSIKEEYPVIGQTGKIILTIINKGFADAKFVSLKINPQGYTLLSEENVYIGTISSDDFETVEAGVIFKTSNPRFNAVLEYKNFDNEDMKEIIELEVNVYTQEKALELGIIQKSKIGFYITIFVSVVVLWLIYRKILKVIRIRKSKNQGENKK